MPPDDSLLALLWDPLFRRPLFTGLLLAVALSLLGAGLRLRQQWLAALGVSQMAAAGGVAGALLGWPILLGAAISAGLAGAVRALLRNARNEHYAVMLLLGWSLTLLLALFGHHGENAAQLLLNGQLYFTRWWHLWLALSLLVALLAAGIWLSRRLLVEHLYPDFYRANDRYPWRHVLVFEALLVAGVVLSIAAVGVMAAFAMLFVPPWVAFGLARGWRAALLLSLLLGLLCYLVGFTVALWLDLPFGPTLVAVLMLALPLRFLPRWPASRATSG